MAEKANDEANRVVKSITQKEAEFETTQVEAKNA